jgi:hypoxanthine phosphoribosyltransferase
MYYLFKNPGYRKYLVCDEHTTTGWSIYPLKAIEQMSVGFTYNSEENDNDLAYCFSNYELIVATENLNTIIKDHPELLI